LDEGITYQQIRTFYDASNNEVAVQLYCQRTVTGDQGSVDRRYGATVTIVFYADHVEVTINGTFRYRWIMGDMQTIERV